MQQLPATIALVLLLPLLWFLGLTFTPAGEVGGVLALSVAEYVNRLCVSVCVFVLIICVCVTPSAILLHIRPWVYVTAGFYHPHLLQVCVSFSLSLSLCCVKRDDCACLYGGVYDYVT